MVCYRRPLVVEAKDAADMSTAVHHKHHVVSFGSHALRPSPSGPMLLGAFTTQNLPTPPLPVDATAALGSLLLPVIITCTTPC